MKFLNWIFNMRQRHYKEAVKYENGGVKRRVWVIVLSLLLVAATLVLEYFTLLMYKENIVIAIFMTLLAFAFIGTALDYLGAHSTFGFKCAMWGSLASLIFRYANKKSKNAEVVEEKQVEEINKEIKTTKKLKWLDLFVGIYCLVLAFGLIAGIFVMIGMMIIK